MPAQSSIEALDFGALARETGLVVTFKGGRVGRVGSLIN